MRTNTSLTINQLALGDLTSSLAIFIRTSPEMRRRSEERRNTVLTKSSLCRIAAMPKLQERLERDLKTLVPSSINSTEADTD